MRRLASCRPASLGIAFSVVLLALPAGAQVTTTATFSEYASPFTTEYQAAVGAPVTSGGYDFYETEGFNGPGSRNVLATWGTDPADPGSVNVPVNVGSSTAMFGTVLGFEIDMFPAGTDLVFGNVTGQFRLHSIDVAHLYSSSFSPFALGSIGLEFFGFGPGTSFGVISQAFTIPVPPVVDGVQTPVLNTLTFDDRWNGLYNVWWFQGTGSGTAHQFTNVNATLLPEPGTYLLVLTGLGGVGLVGMRRRHTRS